ncbi:MAG: SDR family oxidoreductase [Pseudomonadota bacterium]
MDSPVVLISGASGGIGQAVARECARHGARVAVHYNSNAQRAKDLMGSLEGSGHESFAADITAPDAVPQLVESVRQSMGSLDVLVNNAGISQRHDISAIDYDAWQSTWRRVVDTNLTAAGNLAFCASQVMLEQGGGRIVNVSSRGAFRGEPMMPWYGASKAGMNAMGQSMAQALSPKGVFVFTVAPGFVETPMAEKILASPEGENIRAQSPMGRVAQPDELGNIIRYLALEAPEFMTGCIVDLNGASYLRS